MIAKNNCTALYIREGAVEGRKPLGRPRNAYIYTNISTEKRRWDRDRYRLMSDLKSLSGDREKWITKMLNVVNQPSTG